MKVELPTGLVMAVEEAGDSLPLLLIHGFPLNRSMWSEQLAELSREARCIAPDLRGFGETGTGGLHGIDQYADDMAELLEVLGVQRAVVCGLSMGGYVALSMWKRHPMLVHAMVLADTKAGADTSEGKSKRDELIALTQREGVNALAAQQLPGMLGKTSRSENPELVERVRDILESAPEAGVIGALQAMRDRHDSTAILSSVQVPTLVIVGEEDALTPVKEARSMFDAMPGSRLEIIPGAGHLSSMERPRDFNQAVGSFLSTLVGS